jgi:hypothetical protein
MIRTVWLAVLCLVLVSVLATAKALRTSASIAAGSDVDETPLYTIQAQAPLIKSDRLDLKEARLEAPLPVVLQVIEPIRSTGVRPRPPAEPKVISRDRRDPMGPSSRRTESRKKTKASERKLQQAVERVRASESVKPCSRPGALGNLLRSINLSPACA